MCLHNTFTNSTDHWQTVKFTITPYTLNDKDEESCTGIPITVLVYVEPTTNVDARPEVDTICDGDLTSITIQTTSTPTHPTEFRWKAWAENAGAVEVLPVGWIEGLTVADTIAYPLDNQTDQAQRVYGLTIITTSIVKSLLTSLCQREELPLFDKEGRGEI